MIIELAFFAYRKLFYEYLKNGWDRFDMVFRIECRHLNESLEEFLEEEIVEANELWDNTISLKKNLEQFRVCWIIDGYDEKTNVFDQFLNRLQKQFGTKHTFIVTTRPDIDIKIQVNLTTVNIEKLDMDQIYLMLEMILNNDAKFHEFTENGKLCVEYKDILDVPLNLYLVAELIKADKLDLKELRNVINKTLILYELILQQNVLQCVKRHEDQSRYDQKELLDNVQFWFKFLCRIAAEGIRDRLYAISEDQIQILNKECTY